MKHFGIALSLALIVGAGIALPGTGPASAQSGGGYDLSWSTIDGGGGQSTGGSYTLGGTMGQPDAGASSGGSYTLGSGFWLGGSNGSSGSGSPATQQIFLPVMMK